MLKFFLENLCLLFILNFIIFIHEFGHYLCAKLFSVHVDICFIGFGTQLFEFKDSSGTTWIFCAIPLGGYISLLDLDIDSKKEIEVLSPLKNCLIAICGPLFNFLLFFIAYLFVFTNLEYNINSDFKNESSLVILSKSEIEFLNSKTNEMQNYTPNYKDCFSLIVLRMKNVCCNLSNMSLLGPIKIMRVLRKSLNRSFVSTIYSLANLSLFFGLFNLIPIYILDGGVIIIYLYMCIFKTKLSERANLILLYYSIILIGSILCYILLYEIYPIFLEFWSNR